jgi:hypothetical protein
MRYSAEIQSKSLPNTRLQRYWYTDLQVLPRNPCNLAMRLKTTEPTVLLVSIYNIDAFIREIVYIVAHRPAAKRGLCKQRPFLGSDSVHTFPILGSRFLIMQQLDTTMDELCFLCGPCRVGISKGQSSFSQSCTRSCEERTWAREAKESLLLEAVARERLVKTQQAWKGLAGAVVICELLRLVVAL